ncbi:MAG: biotin--[acetyl-CoA-carboxylase] ligase [PVC group bacterium]|nr:biotin--[acetyl-CoA-carboxylase] ligase [PVC group bacterium]
METKVLNFLKDNRDFFVSGEDICRKLKVSRTAVWKHIQNLKRHGYEIVAQPHLGYRLEKIPDSLLPDEIVYKLKTKKFGQKVVSYASIGSTNDAAYTLAEQNAMEGTLVVAEQQTKGKGRMGRSWKSPHGEGIYASLILRPVITPEEAGKITLMAAVSIAKTIRQLSGLPAVIKWPNDIMIENEKICGILTEMSAELDMINFVVLGVGININTDSHKLPPGATSVCQKLGREINRVEFLRVLLLEMERHYEKIKKKKFTLIIDEWRNLSTTLGNRIKVKWRGRIIEGQAMDVDENGALIMRDDLGFLHHVLSGDVHTV